jgi:hypothetical protein
MRGLLALFVLGLYGLSFPAAVVAGPVKPPKPSKVSICHICVDDSCLGGDTVAINISAKALPAHLAHGDCVLQNALPSGSQCDSTDTSPEDGVCDNN